MMTMARYFISGTDAVLMKPFAFRLTAPNGDNEREGVRGLNDARYSENVSLTASFIKKIFDLMTDHTFRTRRYYGLTLFLLILFFTNVLACTVIDNNQVPFVSCERGMC